MKGLFINDYMKNNVVYNVYQVEGTAEELLAFRNTESAKSTDPETGKDLWFTRQFNGNTVELAISKNNRVYADNGELRRFADMCGRMGTVGEQMLMKKISELSTKRPVRAIQNVTVNDTADDVLDGL